jgi:hypothetical protein
MGTTERFFSQIFIVSQTKNLGTFWLETCVFTSVQSSNSPFFIRNKNFKYHKLEKKNATILNKKEPLTKAIKFPKF